MALLASDRLEAFAAVASEGSFTRAAKRIGVTQSAVSQRVRKLEEDLSVTLILRRRDQARLTAEGETLLRYVRAREGLETEMLSGLRPAMGTGHVGVLRVAGFSSVTRSIVVPALAPLLAGQSVVAHVFARELRDLPAILRSGEADLVLTDRPSDEPSVESRYVGDELNVMVEARRGGRADRFLDHDPDDTITERFARLNGLDTRAMRRAYLDDIYGILDGVAAGWGRAVVSAHLVPGTSLHIVPGHRPLRTPVHLHARATRHRTALEAAAIAAIEATCARVLAPAAVRAPATRKRVRRAVSRKVP